MNSQTKVLSGGTFRRPEGAREADPGPAPRGLRPEKSLEMNLAYCDECRGTFLSFFSANTGEVAATPWLPDLRWNLRLSPLTLTSARRRNFPMVHTLTRLWDVFIAELLMNRRKCGITHVTRTLQQTRTESRPPPLPPLWVKYGKKGLCQKHTFF